VDWTAQTLTAAVGGRLVRASARPIGAAFIDTRRPVAGGVFVPIVAERDGHAFLEEAIRADAAAVLVGRGRPIPAADVTVVEVEDTLAALSAMGRAARDRIAGPVVAVTGSNGKTTTRAFVAAALRTRFAAVCCTRGNLNNHLGVPLTLCGDPADAEAAVIEIGTSAPGEVDRLARIVRPRVAVVTSIALEHVASMGTLDDIARAEFEVAAHVITGGSIVLPDDEPRLHALVDDALRRRCRVVTFGEGPGARVRICEVALGERTFARLATDDGEVTVRLQPFGAHNARNAAAALAVALELGLPVARCAEALAEVEPVGDRGRVVDAGGHWILADCYNANPGSMSAALASLAALRGTRPGPLLAVLGDMLELGADERALHAQVGRLAAQLRLDGVFGVGLLAAEIAHAAREAGIPAAHSHDGIDAAVAWVRARLAGAPPGAVLVKASRGMRLERVVERLSA
jgi:UDP-N-acetylmuramoyl-tripeptide--D-alanyl-D-alanine ligase